MLGSCELGGGGELAEEAAVEGADLRGGVCRHCEDLSLEAVDLDD